VPAELRTSRAPLEIVVLAPNQGHDLS